MPLATGSHHQVSAYRLENGTLQVVLTDTRVTGLRHPEQLVGYLGAAQEPRSILLKNNSLHIEIQVDSKDNIGAADRAGVKDIRLEAALTTIMDCEDSVCLLYTSPSPRD